MNRIEYRNQTIIVTGASSGLGEEFARQLAGRGSSLVLVARRADRLERLAEELTRTHGVTVTVVARDLGQPDAGRTLRAELESRGIYATGLVNNAGFGTHNAFPHEDPGRLQDMVALNVGALVDLSRAYFEPLTSAETGVLINVSSLLWLSAHPVHERVRRHQSVRAQLHRRPVGGGPWHRTARPRSLPGRHGHRVLRRRG